MESSTEKKTDSSQAPSILKLFTCTKLEDLGNYTKKSNQKLISVSLNDSLQDAFSKLISLNIHTLPIFDPHQNQYIGFVDISDFAPYLLLILGGKLYPFIPWNCRDLSSLAEARPFRCLDSKLTVLEALQENSWKGVHSLPIGKEGNAKDLIGMASQSSFLQWLVDSDPKALGPEFNQSLRQLKIGTLGDMKEAVSIQADLPLLQVLDTLVCEKVSACAIIDPQGHLIGNISASDLSRVTEEDNSKYLNHPVHTYLSAFGLAQPVTCVEDDSLLEVLKKVCSLKIHRIYCVTEEGTLQSAVTLRDLLEGIVRIATNTIQIQ